MSRGPWKGMTIIAALVVVLTGFWLTARASVSPEQRVADAAPPPPAVASAALEERVLQDSIVVRGRVEVRQEVAVRGPAPPPEGLAVVEDLPAEVGGEVSSGQVVAVVAGRPVMVLAMPVPLWRTLRPGDEGTDVERFQRALQDLGYGVGADGVYGPATQQAVRAWYRDRGFAAAEEAVAQTSDEATIPGAATPEGPETDTGEGEAALGSPALQPEEAVVVPLGEVVGVQVLPATVVQLPVAVGGEVAEGAVAVLSSADHVVRAHVEPARSALLTAGTRGTAEVDGSPERWDVEVVGADVGSGVADPAAEGSGGSDGMTDGGGSPEGQGAVVFAPSVPFGPDLLGRSVRVEVTLSTTDVPVLAAPIAAIRTDADGEYLQVRGDDGESQRVSITPGRSIGGWVELLDPDDLEPGVEVLLGR